VRKPKLSAKDVRKIADRFGINNLTHGRVSILAIRGYYKDSMGKVGVNDRGIYDDAMFVMLHGRVLPFQANTDPSAWRTGIATLKPGKWRFIAGKHKLNDRNGYPALRQYGNMTVTRDNQKAQTGYFGINLHRGGSENTSSLGCQTIPAGQWDKFITAVYDALKVTDAEVMASPTGVADKFVDYVLIEESEMQRILSELD